MPACATVLIALSVCAQAAPISRTHETVALNRTQTRFNTLNASKTALKARAQNAPNWIALPIVTEEALKAGLKGGEGSQWPRALAISPTEPDFMMMATDVGGLYRSLNGGRSWQVCMVGWDSRGGNAFAIDPKNSSRIIGVGGNGNDFGNFNGLYLSTDKGASWKHTLPFAIGNDDRESLAYDPSSFNKTLGYCTVAYFDSRDQGLMKTIDGGLTWNVVNKDLSHCIVRVHPTKGFVYLASNENPGFGFYKSVDGGVTFQKKNAMYTLGLDVSPAAPDNVYLSRWDKIQVSNDGGETFHYIGTHWPTDGLTQGVPVSGITVSPVEPRNMACWIDAGNWRYDRFFSVDGGQNWKKSNFDNAAKWMGKTAVVGTPMPYNNRNGIWAWHPTKANVVFGIGGDWVTRSDDSGANFQYSSDGENAVMTGGSFNFSPTNPGSVFLSFQDYNGAFTLDNGRSWNYRDVSGNGWGGYEYGGYAIDEKVMWSGDAPSWGGPRRLKLSRDGGTTWTIQKDATGKEIVFGGADVSYSDPKNPNVAFASNWRSVDKGVSWKPMPDCDGVFTSNPTGDRELYGRKGDDIVRSSDGGATWTKAATISGGISDLAYDHKNKRFWIASQDVLKKWDNGVVSTVETPKDQYGSVRVSSVAVDPLDPNIVYAASHKDLYACNNAVVRSTDGGKTWSNLTVTTPLANDKIGGGPHEVQWLRVHPKTRELWVAGQCYGNWKIAPPSALR